MDVEAVVHWSSKCSN